MDTRTPKILLVGANGQVGGELRTTLAPLGRIVVLDRAKLDLSDTDAIAGAVAATAPDVIVNAAAYTQVDKAESEPELAQRINADAPAAFARAAAGSGAVLIHYSTDYIFDGNSSVPYREEDPAAPLNVYGRTKHAGDLAVLDSGCDGYILRVAWVYGTRGSNFLRTIQRLAAEGKELRIVADQHGAPTWSRTIAENTASVLAQILGARAAGTSPAAPGVYHMAAPDATTWAGFAQAILDDSAPDNPRSVTPITTDQYPTPARRPRRSLLDSSKLKAAFGLALPPWRDQLRACLTSAG